MIICKNCGAEFDAKAAKCPYCGHENAAVAQDAYHKKVDAYVREREEINKLPARITIRRAFVFAVGIVIIMAMLVVMPIVNKKYQDYMLQKNILIMKEYVDNGNYLEFYEFYEKIGRPIQVGDYWEIENAYELYLRIGDEFDDVNEYYENAREDFRVMLISDILCRIRNLHDFVTEKRSDDLLYGNEQHLDEILELGKAYVMERLPIDSEFLEEIFAEQNEDEIGSRFSTYSKRIVEKMK